jgi:hypothetical protein
MRCIELENWLDCPKIVYFFDPKSLTKFLRRFLDWVSPVAFQRDTRTSPNVKNMI